MSALVAEARKVPAFLRRDWLTMLSYRAAFVGDLLAIAVQAIMFGFLSKLVDPATLPSYNGVHAGYFEFVMIGVVIATVSGLLLQKVSTAIRQEQLMGTLEALMATPTTGATLQIGSVAYTLLFVPIRAAILLGAFALGFGLDFHLSGIWPALALLVAFLPFTWGLGLLSAGLIITFKRGANVTGFALTLLGLISGAVFPIALLPGALRALAGWNPFALCIDGARDALIGGTGWAPAATSLLKLAPLSIVGFAIGVLCFRAAIARERRRGTLGAY